MNKQPIKAYGFSNTTLIALLREKLNFVARDETQFNDYGFSSADRQSLGQACDDFADFPDDIEFESDKMIATENKNTARKELLKATRKMMQRVANRYGKHRAEYKVYGTKGMHRMKDIKLEVLGFQVERYLRADLSNLASEGLTLAKVDAYKILALNFTQTIADQEDAIGNRSVATEDRIKLGNALFKRFVRVCNIGKTIWAEDSEAKYNDYLWYKKAMGK